MSGYIGPAPVPQATQTRQTFTATSGQTSFATIGYVAGGQFIQVYLNGVLLKLTDDYTAANGSDIVLTSGAATGDILEFITFADFTVNNQNFTGGLTVDNDGSTVLTVDRATSDGTIIDLQKSGSSVGIIGVSNSGYNLFMTTSDTGLAFNYLADEIVPCTSNGAYRSGAIDLGDANSRFKDLYLSGGVYLGGTGSANKLDDYEEGTWTPVITGTTGNPTVTVISGHTGGIYTKVGDTVFISFEVRWSAITGGSGNCYISGLPFTRKTTLQPDGDRSTFDFYQVTVPGGGINSVISAATGGTTLGLSFGRTANTTAPLPVANLLSVNPGFIRASLFYKV